MTASAICPSEVVRLERQLSSLVQVIGLATVVTGLTHPLNIHRWSAPRPAGLGNHFRRDAACPDARRRGRQHVRPQASGEPKHTANRLGAVELLGQTQVESNQQGGCLVGIAAASPAARTRGRLGIAQLDQSFTVKAMATGTSGPLPSLGKRSGQATFFARAAASASRPSSRASLSSALACAAARIRSRWR
jgi:hypothetical protein